MAHKKCTSSSPKAKQVTAQEVHQLVSETLRTHFNLGMSDSLYDAQDVWDVLIAAAVERITIEMACGLLEAAPSPNTVREVVKHLLTDQKSLAEIGRDDQCAAGGLSAQESAQQTFALRDRHHRDPLPRTA